MNEENIFQEILDFLSEIKGELRDRIFSFTPASDEDDELDALEYGIDQKIENIEKLIPDEAKIADFFSLSGDFILRKLKKILFLLDDKHKDINIRENLISILYEIHNDFDEIEKTIDINQRVKQTKEFWSKALNNEREIREKAESVDTILNYLRQNQSQKIYIGEADKFKKLAFIYESFFYALIFLMFIYFSGLTIYIPDFNFIGLHIGFPAKLGNTGNISFYIQKISVLVLSSTLAAFLLKRSFMNRELFQEAYRIAQELNALPPYIQSFSQEVQDKIRFDLTYKYFGRDYNSNNNGNDKGSDNFMAENIKANTEFLKALKDISIRKEDKAKSEVEL